MPDNDFVAINIAHGYTKGLCKPVATSATGPTEKAETTVNPINGPTGVVLSEALTDGRSAANTNYVK
jgi:hypothetical protein